MKLIARILVFIGLTIVSQIGGILNLISIVLVPKKSNFRILKRTVSFTSLYLLFTFLIVPYIAPTFGRVKIEDSEHLSSHSFFYKLLNRDYVTPELFDALTLIAEKGSQSNKEI